MVVVCVTLIPPSSFNDLKVFSSVNAFLGDLDLTISLSSALRIGMDAATIVVASSAPVQMNSCPASYV